MKKRLYLLLTIAFLMFGSQMVSATELKTGLAEPEVVGIPMTVAEEDAVDADRVSEIEAETAADTDKWDAYASLYYYNQLSPEYRETWDALDVVCKSYFDASKTVTNENGYLESVSVPSGTTQDELRTFWSIYIYSNPQYYFLRNKYSYSYAYGDATQSPISVRLCMYSAFYDGETRAAETAKVEAKLEEWQTQINACTTDAAKLQKMQDLICAKVTYNYDAANNVVDEQVSFSQSPYSVFCGDSTVCAGYADTFYMLCNASGMDAISVTSPGHQWNKVRINDSWYNFDVTWDDNYTDSWGYPVYRYYGRSDAMYDTDIGSGNESNISNHQEETYWESYLPPCTLDSAPASSFKTPGTFATINAQTATPEIVVSYTNGTPQVTLGCATENAAIYYTTDGTNPSVAKNKSNRYRTSFAAEVDTQIKAIAVCDTYLDSEVANKTVELEKYAIDYVLDGGVNHTDNPASYDVLDTVTLQVPTKVGYIFEGWYADEEGSQEVTGIAIGSTGPRTFYAMWSPITYDLSFDGNGAAGGSMSGKSGCKYDTAYALASNNYTRTGYTFAGWSKNEDGSGTVYADEASVMNLTATDGAKVTLYAQWTPITYSISYDGNGAEDGAMAVCNDCAYDVEYKLSANNYEKTGYVFVEWNTEVGGGGTSYADEESVKNLTATDDANITLYAQWRLIKYSIVFDGNGATGGSMSEQSNCEYDTEYALASNNYKKTGYIFAGWNTETDGGGTSYVDASTVKNLATTDGATVTLYAQWAPITYDILYDGNGATSGSMSGQGDCEYDTEYVLASNNYTRTGYIFAGWNTKADGSGTSYADEAAVKNLTATEGANVTLYAQWTPITYDISYDGNEATGGSMSEQSDCEYDTTYVLAANNYEKTGYTFVGWNTEQYGFGEAYADSESVKNLTATEGVSVTLYAQWTPITYGIAYDGNGATDGNMSAQSGCEYDMIYMLAANNYERTGYTFVGWNTEAEGNGAAYSDEDDVENLTAINGETVTLYAQWTPITYSISYDGNGAEDGAVMSRDDCVYDVEYKLSANSYVKTGYVLAEWNTEAGGGGTSYTDEESVKNLAAIDGANITLYAQWRLIKYSIVYDGNGATGGEMAVQSGCEYDAEYALEINNYERTGYTFAGWNTEAGGNGTAYADEVAVKNLTETNGATVILYAQWTPITYDISYDGNGATGGSMSGQNDCVYETEYELASSNYTRTGCIFAGWNTKADGNGTSYADASTVKNLTTTEGATVTLYAVWTPITYTILFDGNGATGGSMSEQSNCKYDTAYALAANSYEKTGYIFSGWNTEAGGNGTAYADEVAVKNLTETNGATVILYAQWTPITYDISYDGNGATDGNVSGQNDCEYDTEYELASNSYTRTGYIFAGWNTEADGNGTSCADASTVRNLTATEGATVTLYAQWTPITYTILFDGNGATGGEMEKQSDCAYDTAVTLNANGYVKTGNGFRGWSTNPDGSGTLYADEASVKNLALTDGASVTLYAQWGASEYSISYDGNGATGGEMSAQSGCVYDAEYLLNTNNYTRTGYVFAGWNTNADASGVAYADKASVKNLSMTDGEVVTLYAQWTPITYSVAFAGNGATGGSTAAQSNWKYGTSYALNANGFSKTGYTFVGWNTKADGSGISYADKASLKNLTTKAGEKITLYAQWKINVYALRFDGNKATKGSMAQMTLLYGKSYVLSGNAFKRTGYKFSGWNTQKNGSGTAYKNKASVQNMTSVNGETITLYAQWTANKYTVKFNGNGATSGSMKKMKKISYGKKYRLKANKFKKEGYKFVGWNTKKNGKGKMYKNKAKIKNLTSKNGKSVTLYAQWKKI